MSVIHRRSVCGALWWKTKLSSLLCVMSLRVTIFQSEGAPPHFYHRVHAFLFMEFPDRWIVRGAPIPWSSYSQELTPLNFSSGGGGRKRYCSSWKSAECEWVAQQNHQSWRMRYQWNASKYLGRNWISSWCVLCN
jgi:hypothetical protein